MENDEKVRILLVDDKAEALLALEMILDGLRQEVVKARSGREALRLLLREDFAVILLDVNMPGMDGFETAELIRQRTRSKQTPIIFLTAFSDEMYVARGYSLGAVDYILAPVVPEILRAKVGVFAELHRKTQQLKQQTTCLAQRAAQLHRLKEASLAITAAPALEAIRQVLEEWACRLIGATRATAIFEVGEGASSWERVGPAADAERGAGVGGDRLVVPLLGRSGQQRGILQVSGKPTGAMTEDDRALMVQLAQIAAIAMENVISAHAREANRLKDQFLATLSHELRTPLHAILGWTKVLRTGGLPESTAARALEVIERNVHAQTKLIDDLLDVSRITSGKMQLTIGPVFLAAVVQSVIDTLQPVAEKHQVQLSSVLDASTEVMGDADRLHQAVLNLIENAIKFTQAGGRVDVSLDHRDAMARLQVTDTGQGIHPQFLPHVFDYFRQGDRTTRGQGGLGIGLSVVKHIVKLHDGSVRAESPGLGQGATFVVELPLRHVVRSTIQARLPTLPPVAEPYPLDLNGLRVVLVDDDQDGRDVIAEALVRSHATVTAVASANEAMESIRKTPPDVLISDISMPYEDGYALIRAVRALRPEEGGRIPAVALTAYASQEDRSRALSAGFQMHLPKPIDPMQLPSLLVAWANASPSALPPA